MEDCRKEVDSSPSSSAAAAIPRYAYIHLHVIYFGEHDEEYSRIPVKIIVGPGKDKSQLTLLAASASAQDLRTLGMDKEKTDDVSPGGVLDACPLTSSKSCVTTLKNKTLGLEFDSSEEYSTSGADPDSSDNTSSSKETTSDMVHDTPDNSVSESDPSESPKKSPVESLVSTAKSFTHWSKMFKMWKRRSMKRLASFPPFIVPKLSKGKSGRSESSESEEIAPVLSDIYNFKSTLQHFSLSDLEKATDNFNPDNIIGRGGYAEVYRGCLKNGQLIAVKRLNRGTSDERTASFLSELGIIAHVNHPRTAKLIGCGVEGGMHLVFQLSPLGSLGSILHRQDVRLEWKTRYKIALGIAEGLLYLHESCQRRIIHRDIKADNILLTEDFEPQICDFGLAKWLPKQLTHHNVSKFEGTFGYFAPEYFMHGVVDEKTDVYSFGVLLLEIITGRKALDEDKKSVILWAKPFLNDGFYEELVDPALVDEYDSDELDRMAMTASICVEQSPVLRPRMNQVVQLLTGDKCPSDCEKECEQHSLKRTFSEEHLDAQEYNSTKYLGDLRKHRELALGS